VEARLSPADVATHVALFDQPWQVALVVTPGDAPAGGFFRIPADGSRSLAYLPFYELLEARSEEPRLNSSHEWSSYAVFCLKKKQAPVGHLQQVIWPYPTPSRSPPECVGSDNRQLGRACQGRARH